MFIKYKDLCIRNAIMNDAYLLEKWWNDGELMAYAGFPNGTGQTAETIMRELQRGSDTTQRRLIIEKDFIPIGEMVYFHIDKKTVEIGIKICVAAKQNQGIGKVVLSMLIDELFELGYQKIILDTDFNNVRAQHVYKQLGFIKTQENEYINQDGIKTIAILYELIEKNFISFL